MRNDALRETETAVTLLGRMGDDLTVANAARASFGRRKEAFDEKDERLIIYLARHGHWSPFSHPQLGFHVRAPLYVARQLWKSHVGACGGDAGQAVILLFSPTLDDLCQTYAEVFGSRECRCCSRSPRRYW